MTFTVTIQRFVERVSVYVITISVRKKRAEKFEFSLTIRIPSLGILFILIIYKYIRAPSATASDRSGDTA